MTTERAELQDGWVVVYKEGLEVLRYRGCHNCLECADSDLSTIRPGM